MPDWPRACLFLFVELGQDLVTDVAVGPDVLNIIAVLERLDHPEHLAGAIEAELDLHGRDEGSLSRVVVDAGALERGTDGHEVARLAHDLEGLTNVVDLFRARIKNDLEQVVLAQAGLGDDHDALAGEDVGDAPGVSKLAAVAVEGCSHFSGRTVAVVGEALDQDGHTVGGISLVGDRLPVGTAGCRTAVSYT